MSRKIAVSLSVLAMSISVYVLLGVEHARHQIKENFYNTVSGVDLIGGSRTSNINLLLYSVFRVGSPTRNIKFSTYEELSRDSNVEWAVPISLGDSHKGFRVVGTIPSYFEKIKYGKDQSISFARGQKFQALFDVVLGSEVAKSLNYRIDDKLVLSHGISEASFLIHKNFPFTVSGILRPTGTPIDQAVYVDLAGLELIHMHPNQQQKILATNFEELSIRAKEITAIMLGLKSKIRTFKFQDNVNRLKIEPLVAVIPGVALAELWQTIGFVENSMFVVTGLVFIAACLGLSAMLLSSIRERYYEIQLLRIIGAPSMFLFLLIELESLLITFASIFIGMSCLSLSINFLQDYLTQKFGILVSPNIINEDTISILGFLLLCVFVVSLIPAIIAYNQSKNLVAKH